MRGIFEITVIDPSDHVGWLAAATRVGEIYMTDVNSMVVNVLNAAGTRSIDRLNILDHGNQDGFEVGSDWVTLESIRDFEPQLRRLNGKFSRTGFCHLQHCDVGNNFTLLATLAGIIGCPVYAGRGRHNPVYRFNFGNYVSCPPPANGTAQCLDNVARP